MKKEENEILDKLLKEHPIEEEVKFSDLDLSEKQRDNAFMVVKYRDLLIRETIESQRLETLMEKLIGERYKYYRFDDQKEWVKIEIEKYCIPSDKKIIRMKRILRRQDIRVKFFEMCVKAMESQGWRMKGFIDSMRGV